MYEIVLSCSVTVISLYNLLSIDLVNFNIGFLFDSLSSLMLVVISCISFFVHFYSITYMSHDPYICRFISYLSLFTFFMMLLVTSDNFLQMFVG